MVNQRLSVLCVDNHKNLTAKAPNLFPKIGTYSTQIETISTQNQICCKCRWKIKETHEQRHSISILSLRLHYLFRSLQSPIPSSNYPSIHRSLRSSPIQLLSFSHSPSRSLLKYNKFTYFLIWYFQYPIHTSQKPLLLLLHLRTFSRYHLSPLTPLHLHLWSHHVPPMFPQCSNPLPAPNSQNLY